MKVIVKVTIRFLVESFFRYDLNLYETNTWGNIWPFRYLFAIPNYTIKGFYP